MPISPELQKPFHNNSLCDPRRHLQESEVHLDIRTISRMHQLKSELVSTNQLMESKRASMIELQKHINTLQLKRFELLQSTLARLSSSVSRIYPQLKATGECYLSYPSDPASLYSEGVTLMARSDGRPWMEVCMHSTYICTWHIINRFTTL
jgi:chromosome segregation ATPase